MSAIPTTAAERFLYGVLSVDPVILSICGIYHPDTDALIDCNVHTDEVPGDIEGVELEDDSTITIRRWDKPCVLITNAFEGANTMETGLAILATDPEYIVRGKWEAKAGPDFIGPVQEGEQLGDYERLAKRIQYLIHAANGTNAAGVVAGCWETGPHKSIRYDKTGRRFCDLGSVVTVLVQDPDEA